MAPVANEWYYALEHDHDILSWACFADYINIRFGSSIHTNSLAEMKALYRTGTVTTNDSSTRCSVVALI